MICAAATSYVIQLQFSENHYDNSESLQDIETVRVHLNCEVVLGVKTCDMVNRYVSLSQLVQGTSMMMVSALCAAAALSTEY